MGTGPGADVGAVNASNKRPALRIISLSLVAGYCWHCCWLVLAQRFITPTASVNKPTDLKRLCELSLLGVAQPSGSIGSRRQDRFPRGEG